MAVNDPIADMLVRIRNAANAGFEKVSIPHSIIKESILNIIASEGFIRGVEVVGELPRKSLVVDIKYRPNGKPVFAALRRTSKLGRRYYLSARDIKASRQGMGVAILTTSKGVMKDVDAKRQGVGGEVICTIW